MGDTFIAAGVGEGNPNGWSAAKHNSPIEAMHLQASR